MIIIKEKIIKNCCRFCIDLGVNCLGCVIAAEHSEAPKFKEYCDDCIAKGECIKKFQNMKDRTTCWTLSDDDREIYRVINPEFDEQLKKVEKESEEKAAEAITDEDAERMIKLLELRKKKKAEKEGQK